KTYNSGDSPILTNSTTDPPVPCLSTAERTGSSVFRVLWSYVEVKVIIEHYIDMSVMSKQLIVTVLRFRASSFISNGSSGQKDA
ncbi:hypothetical protein P171DRAFT_366270, partial [Karstenula rhodostoma CBS 690.94]